MIQQLPIDQVFPEKTLKEAFDIGQDHEKLKALCERDIEQINANVGHENDPDYLAYILEYAMNQLAAQPQPHGESLH